MSYLIVSGVDISPYVQVMTTSYEPIWNTKAGRTITGDFQGRIINSKWKINMSTTPLSQSESAIIHSVLREGDYVSVQFIPQDSPSDTLVTTTMYVSAIEHQIYSYAEGLPRVLSLTCALVEK